MRVLRVIATMDPASGGPCQGIRNSIPALKMLGVLNEVVSLDDAESAFLGKDEFTVHALGRGKGPWNYSSSLGPWLIDHAKNYDAIVVHGLWLHHGFSVRKALRNSRLRDDLGPRIYVMPHGMLDPYFQKDRARRLKAFRNLLYWYLVEERNISSFDGVLFTCAEEKRLAAETFSKYRPRASFDVGYGVADPPGFVSDMSARFEAKCPGVKGKEYLLFLSRIHPKKGVELLLEAYGCVVRNRKGSSHDFPDLVIAGPIESSFASEVQKLAEELLSDEEVGSCRPRIHFPGMLTGEEKWGAFHGCEAFVLPSHQENFGIAVVEALACKKPVLISNKVNIWREIKNAGGGLVYEDDLQGTTCLLTDFLKMEPDEVKQMGENARRCYEQNFGVEAAAERFSKAIGH